MTTLVTILTPGYADWETALLNAGARDSRFESDGRLVVSLTATNTGERAGSTVVQLYVTDDKSTEPRPAKELKAFEKVRLAPGESRSITLVLEARAFAWYREAARHWLVEAGSFTIRVGQSSADLPLSASISRATTLMLPV